MPLLLGRAGQRRKLQYGDKTLLRRVTPPDWKLKPGISKASCAGDDEQTWAKRPGMCGSWVTDGNRIACSLDV